jgi:LmbE family N-acetylglucosaminyl deacetylase
MIFAPHPDDEVLMTSGVIENAIKEGNKVRVVIVTNGDFGASNKTYGQIRLIESLKALTFLGVRIEDIIFLGYGDTGMSREDSFLRKLYYSITDTAVIQSSVGMQTYGTSLKLYSNFVLFKDFHSYYMEHQVITIKDYNVGY